ncbi:MAG TPA: ABC transporter permease [Xanthobacteraceae bacterium]|nr:ABC transporter permease [Xanthobacteraceae bacterium]
MERKSFAPWLWLFPAGALLIPFFVLPLAIVVRNSFYIDDPMGLLVPAFTGANYYKVVTDSYYVSVFTNTLTVAALSTVATLLIGYPFAQLIVRLTGFNASLMLWCVYVPLYVSVIMRAFGWTIILADSGIVNETLLALGIIKQPIRMLFEVEGMTIGIIHRYLPLMLIPLIAALQKIDGDLYKASANLGASGWSTWMRVTVPISLPGIVAGSQLVFAGVLSDYAMPALMGSTKFQLAAPAIYYEAVTNTAWALAGAMATLVLFIVALFLFVMNVTLKRVAPWASTL